MLVIAKTKDPVGYGWHRHIRPLEMKLISSKKS